MLWVFIRTTLLLPLVGVAFLCVRRRSASVRHGVLLVGLVCLFVLPVLPFAGPRLTVPYGVSHSATGSSVLQYAATPMPAFAMPVQTPMVSATPVYKLSATPVLVPRPEGRVASRAVQAGRAASVAGGPVLSRDAVASGRVIDWHGLVLGVWLAGFFLLMLRLVLSHWAAWRLIRQGMPEGLPEMSGGLPGGRARVVLSDRIAMPMTWGIAPAVILLPSGASDWTSARLRAALLHERAHIGRRDWLVQLLSEAAQAAYWGHPFVWLLVRQLRLEAEMACDDAVLAAGLVPSAYAGELVECVRQARRSVLGAATVAMADRHSMTARVHAVLETGRSRTQLQRRAALLAAVVGLVTTVVVGASWTGRADTSDKQSINTTCTLVYPDGKPATDAVMSVNDVNFVTHAVSTVAYKADQSGTVRFPFDLGKDIVRAVNVSSPAGCALWTRPASGASTTCVLQPFTSLRVHLIGSRGKPVSNVRVCPWRFWTESRRIASWYDEIPGAWTQTTDSNGYATISHLPQGYQITLSVMDDRYASRDLESAIALASAAVSPSTTIHLGPASTISGTVVYGPSHTPVAGIAVAAMSRLSGKAGVTDKNGAFTITRLTSGAYGVQVVTGHGDFTNWVAQPQLVHVGVGARSSGVIFPLIHGGVITGRITDTASGKPVPNVDVIAVSQRSGSGLIWANPAKTDADGIYQMHTIPGNLSVTSYMTDAMDNTGGSQQVSIADGETKTVNFSFNAFVPSFPDPGGWVRTLPNGVSVELVGVTSDPLGNNTQGWWGPDGTPIEDPSELGQAFLPRMGGFGEQYVRRYMYFRVVSKTGVGDVGLTGAITTPSVYESGNMYRGESYLTSGLQLSPGTPAWGKVAVAFNTPTGEFGYRFGVAAGPWTTIADVPNTLNSHANPVHPGQPVHDPYVTIDSHPRIDVFGYFSRNTYRPPVVSLSLMPAGQALGDVSRRFIALDAQGLSVPIGDWNYQMNGDAGAVIPASALKRITHFELQTRDYSWVEFDHIRNVPTVTKGMLSPSDDVATPAALPQFSRILPDGAHLDVIAAMRGRAEGERWWRPDGEALAGRIKEWSMLGINPGSNPFVRPRELFVRYVTTHPTDMEYVMLMSTDVDKTPQTPVVRQENLEGTDISQWPGKQADLTINEYAPAGTNGRKIYLRMGVTTGKWKRIASLPMTLTPSMVKHNWSDATVKFAANQVSFEWLDAAGTLHDRPFAPTGSSMPTGYARRVVAVMKDGTSKTLLVNGNSGDSRGEVYQASYLSFKSSKAVQDYRQPVLDDVRRFDLYVQPYTWETYPAIPADPKG